jgi:putative toxin-antitoxin system antitoxin component (TIGR02293 family)
VRRVSDTLTPFIPTPVEGESLGSAIGLHASNLTELLKQVQRGFHTSTFIELQALLDVSQKELAERIGLSEATLHRRFAEGHFKKEESERLYRLYELFEKTRGLFESQQKAQAWLRKPALALGNQAPLDYAGTELGAREALDLIERLVHGVLD